VHVLGVYVSVCVACNVLLKIALILDVPSVSNLFVALQVQEYHEKYKAGLRAIWDEHKNTLALDRKGSLTFH
jgi:hypothetical protein